ncbi:hypothetical protein, partial [Microbacterium pseudoresistens]|uniref:hypothetical protein n=1 Tax=Microbacterium pseudoresistens TaxID=640634 RepID=UPI0031E52C6F
MLLLDKLTQSAPFKDRHLGGQLLQNAGLSGNDIVRLANMHILVPVATQHPESIKFHDVGAGEYKVSEFHPFQVDWHPAGNGPLGERFEAIGGLASKELHGARTQFPNELEALAKSSIVVEAERYLS